MAHGTDTPNPDRWAHRFHVDWADPSFHEDTRGPIEAQIEAEIDYASAAAAVRRDLGDGWGDAR